MEAERPLDQIRRDTKRANRAPHLRKHSMVPVDIIDSLDTIGIGGPYHHEGPYDATLAPRNRNRKYAPVEAVREGNMAALQATPQEHIMDSLSRHVPLQGVASIPPGHKDFAGRTMDYEEGADLMRESDAGGGAYRRWKDYDYYYHPEDLKGKGEPSYTLERQLKDQKMLRRGHSLQHKKNSPSSIFEMQPTSSSSRRARNANGKEGDGGVVVRQRSYSSSASGLPTSSLLAVSGQDATGEDIRRSNTTGKRFEGLKRRLGSLRRKPVRDEA